MNSKYTYRKRTHEKRWSVMESVGVRFMPAVQEAMNGDAGGREVAGEGRGAKVPASLKLHRYTEVLGPGHAKPLANLAISRVGALLNRFAGLACQCGRALTSGGVHIKDVAACR
jgi:hypothetical protein